MKTPRLITVLLAFASCFLGTAFAQTGPLKINPNTGAIVGPVTAATFISANSLISTSSGFSDGTSSAPGISFSSDTDTGLYRIGANNIGITAGTTVVGAWSTTGLSLGGTIATAVGTAASPILTFGGTGDGFYTPADNQIGIGIGGNSVAVMSASTLTLGTNVALAFAGTGAATTRTNLGLSSLATATPGTDAIAQYITPAIYQSTATAAGTTTLTLTSEAVQRFSGTNLHACKLPDTSTLTTGWSRLILNDSTKNVEVQTNAVGTLYNLQPGQSCRVVCISTAGNTAAAWRVCDVSGTLWTAHKKTETQAITAGTIADVTFPTNVAGNTSVFGGATFTAPSTGSIEISTVIPYYMPLGIGDSDATFVYAYFRVNGGANDQVYMSRPPPFDLVSFTTSGTIAFTRVLPVTRGDTLNVRFLIDTGGGTEAGAIEPEEAHILIKYLP